MTFAAEKSPKPTPIHLTGHVEHVTTQGGFFAIIGDDGQKYQPTNLPAKMRTDGLPIKFDFIINDNVVSTFMWGIIVDVSNVAPLSSKATLTNDERSAISVLLKRMNAFNTKDLTALQKIDVQAKKLSTEQFNSWLANYTNYTLQYVDLSSADSYSLTGTCYYTREYTGGMQIEGTIELAATNFTISKTVDGWKLTELESLKNPSYMNQPNFFDSLKEQALKKYKTNDLTTLLQ